MTHGTIYSYELTCCPVRLIRLFEIANRENMQAIAHGARDAVSPLVSDYETVKNDAIKGLQGSQYAVSLWADMAIAHGLGVALAIKCSPLTHLAIVSSIGTNVLIEKVKI